MKNRAILSSFLILAVAAGAVVYQFTPALASSHREAPSILSSPQVDGTDFYMFRSYEEGRDGFVTLIADYNPLQDPYGGPNYFPLDSNAVYDIHITNDGNVDENLTFRFQMEAALTPFNLTVGGESVDVPLVNVGPFGAQIGDDALTQTRAYSLRLLRGNVEDPDSIEPVTNVNGGATRFGMPFDNIGHKSIPDYDAYASSFIHDITLPGCEPGGRVFAGQRKDPFAVNLGETFDLINITNPVGNPDAERSDTADKNITSLVLEVPIDCLTGDDSDVIGGWTTASLRRTRTLISNPTFEAPDEQSGDLVQVSRLANPLVNEVAIGLPDKDLFNASHPRDDGTNFLQYVTNPSLPELLQILFPEDLVAPNNFPRNDLVEVFLTGIPDLNQDGSTGEMMRLNTSIDPTPRTQQDRLGVIGGDLAGYPNGRRPGDDAVDIALRAMMGILCHQGGGGGGDPNEFTVLLNGDNVVPPTPSTHSGTGLFTLNNGNRLRGVVNHNVLNVFEGSIRQGAAGQNGDRVCRDDTGPIPIRWDCALSPAEVQALLGGDLYVNVHSVNFPNGEIRGQLVPQSTGIGSCSPSDAPSGLAPLTDGAYQGPDQFSDVFPYLRTPLPGSPKEWISRSANLIDDNLAQFQSFVPTDAHAFCEMARNEEGGFELRCNHNVSNPSIVRITKDSPDGEVLWLFDLSSDPPASPDELVRILDETNYLGNVPLELFADGFESGDINSWSNMEGGSTRIGGPLR